MPVSEEQLFYRRQEVQIERRRALIRKEHGIKTYEPHAKQAQFHNAGYFHYRYARTGNRFGKSEMGAAEDVAFARGAREWLRPGDPDRSVGIPNYATKGLIVTSDWDKSREIFTNDVEGAAGLGKIFKYLPKDAVIDVSRNHSGYIDCIYVRHISGGVSEIHFDTVKSFKQNPLGSESSFWDWAHIDEPIPEKMFGAINRGLLDRSGRVWFTCTPLTEPWIDEAFAPELDDQVHDNDKVVISGDSRWMMNGSMDDNPWNTPADIERILSWYDEAEHECRRKGIPTAYSGVIYGKEFDYATHVRSRPEQVGWTSWDSPPRDYTRRFSIDYHFKKNDAVLFVATAPTGHCVVYHEIWRQALLADEVAEIKSFGPTVPGLIDPLASTPNKVNESTALDEVLRLGLSVMPATKDPVNGIRAVKAWLKSRDKNGLPMLLFASHLKRTLAEISRGYVWDPDKNKPVPKNNDMMENLYRLCLQGLDYIEPEGDSHRSIIETRDAFTTSSEFDRFIRGGEESHVTPDRSSRYRK